MQEEGDNWQRPWEIPDGPRAVCVDPSRLLFPESSADLSLFLLRKSHPPPGRPCAILRSVKPRAAQNSRGKTQIGSSRESHVLPLPFVRIMVVPVQADKQTAVQ